MDARISMITLAVDDMNSAIEFYEKGLGFPRVESSPGTVFFNLRGTWLGLYPRDELAKDANVPSEGAGFSGITLAHNLPSEREVDLVFEQAINSGAEQVKRPQQVFWGGYSGYFKDLDGHLWEIAFNPFMWIGPENLDA